MTTYVLGAGASHHAGYPLCKELWPRMTTWVSESPAAQSSYERVINRVRGWLNDPVDDMEAVLTDLTLKRGVFGELSDSDGKAMLDGIRECFRGFFKDIHSKKKRGGARLYRDFAGKVEPGDVIVTFNYDVALENELFPAGRFRVRGGYGRAMALEWPEGKSSVVVLKLHGSINWNGRIGSQGAFVLGKHLSPFVDNVDGLLVDYPKSVLDKEFKASNVVGQSITLILPSYRKRYSVRTSIGPEFVAFYKSLWAEAAEKLRGANRIVIIGYRMPAADREPRKLLFCSTKRDAEVIICCGSSNADVKKQFEDRGFSRVSEAGTFENFLRAPPK